MTSSYKYYRKLEMMLSFFIRENFIEHLYKATEGKCCILCQITHINVGANESFSGVKTILRISFYW